MRSMFFVRTSFAVALLGSAAMAAAGCSAADEGEGLGSTAQAVIGDFLPGLQVDADVLAEAEDVFGDFEGIGDGVGPVFNAQACGQCHSNGAMGGAGEQIERRFGRFDNGLFNPLANRGGSLRQLFTVANFNNPNLPAASRGRCQAGNPTLCCVPLEVEPAEATVRNVGRHVGCEVDRSGEAAQGHLGFARDSHSRAVADP